MRELLMFEDDFELTSTLLGMEPDQSAALEADMEWLAQEFGDKAEVQKATPLEELVRTVGVEVTTRQYYEGERPDVMHDFRWTAPATEMMYNGARVVDFMFPPAKVDIMPAHISRSLAIRENGYQVLTGAGEHLFMGALPASPHIHCVFAVVTERETVYYEIDRQSVRPAIGPVRAWCHGYPPYFSMSARVEWRTKMSSGDNIVMIDGDMWYCPEKKTPSVLVRDHHIVDRKGTRLMGNEAPIPDGHYDYNVALDVLSYPPSRPPVSAAVFAAWMKYEPLPRYVYEGESRILTRFDMKVDVYDIRDRSALVKDPQLRSPAMLRRRTKYREQLRAIFLERVSANVFLFPAWLISQGENWVMFEQSNGRGAAIGDYYRVRVRGIASEVHETCVRAFLAARGPPRGQIACSRNRSYCNDEWYRTRETEREKLTKTGWRSLGVIITHDVGVIKEAYGPYESISSSQFRAKFISG